MNTNLVSPDKINTEIVKEVGSNISAAIIKYFADNNMSSRLDGYQWEFNLVKNEFMSTHPSDAKRIEKIKEALPEAMLYYKI